MAASQQTSAITNVVIVIGGSGPATKDCYPDRPGPDRRLNVYSFTKFRQASVDGPRPTGGDRHQSTRRHHSSGRFSHQFWVSRATNSSARPIRHVLGDANHDCAGWTGMLDKGADDHYPNTTGSSIKTGEDRRQPGQHHAEVRLCFARASDKLRKCIEMAVSATFSADVPRVWKSCVHPRQVSQLASMRCPPSVRIDSGWNWTPWISGRCCGHDHTAANSPVVTLSTAGSGLGELSTGISGREGIQKPLARRH